MAAARSLTVESSTLVTALERTMISNDLEIQLVGLERQTSLLTRLVPISIAVAVVSQMLVAQYVGQPGGAFQLVFIPRSFGSSSYCL